MSSAQLTMTEHPAWRPIDGQHTRVFAMPGGERWAVRALGAQLTVTPLDGASTAPQAEEFAQKYMGKRITPEMTQSVVKRLTERGICVKGYFILGFPTETRAEMYQTVRLVNELWDITDDQPGDFRASVFEFRPYPGTPEWSRLMATGKYKPEQLLDYSAVDLTDGGLDEAMRGRDEFRRTVESSRPRAHIRDARCSPALVVRRIARAGPLLRCGLCAHRN